MSLVLFKNLFLPRNRQGRPPRLTPSPSPSQSTAVGSAEKARTGDGDRRLGSAHSNAETLANIDLESQRSRTAGGGKGDEVPSRRSSTFAAQSGGGRASPPSPSPPSSSPGFFSKIDARLISDATIGLSDGLTVPFALTAGLTALGDTRTVIFGGLAELIAGAISMGLGGYLGAKSELASYRASQDEVNLLAVQDPAAATREIREALEPFGLSAHTLDDVAAQLAGGAPERLGEFVLQIARGEQEPAASRVVSSALTIAAGYFLGGLLPLLPYFGFAAAYSGHGKHDPNASQHLLDALYVSIGVMAVALFAFGYVKTGVVAGWRGRARVASAVWGGVQMVLIGGAAAAAAMGLVKAFNSIPTS